MTTEPLPWRDGWTDDIFLLALRRCLGQMYDECRELRVLPDVLLTVQPVTGIPGYICSERLTPDDVLNRLSFMVHVIANHGMQQ